MIRYREALLCERPITVRRRVAWGECDPAGFVYTPRFGDYVATASGYFTSEILGKIIDPATGRSLGLPMKALSFEFLHFLRPDDEFDMVLTLGDIRTRTFDLLVAASKVGGPPCFRASMSRIVFDSMAGAAVPIPLAMRAQLESYAAGCQASQPA